MIFLDYNLIRFILRTRVGGVPPVYIHVHVPPPGQNTPEMNVSDLIINLCESKPTTSKIKNKIEQICSVITSRFLFGLTQKSKIVTRQLLTWKEFSVFLYRSTLFGDQDIWSPDFGDATPKSRSTGSCANIDLIRGTVVWAYCWVLEPKKLNLDALGPIVSGDEALFPENFFMSEIMVIK